MGKAKRAGPGDTAGWHDAWASPIRRPGNGTRRSVAVRMRDGVRIAIDLHLPAIPPDGARLPTILCQTRYHRRDEYRWLFRPYFWLTDPFRATLRRILRAGYAFVTVDVRGSGASEGVRRMEWSADEVADGREVVDWIRSQPWSDGRVVTTGISYVGVAAEHLLATGHEAVVAAHVRFSPFDIYADITHPGGVLNEHFLRAWAGLNRALDADRPPPAPAGSLGAWLGRGVRGVARVDGDRGRRGVAAAIAAHRNNYDIFEAARRVVFRDDIVDGVCLDDFSPHAAKRGASAGALYSATGYFDGANTLAAVKRFANVDGSDRRLLLGPWDHGGGQNPEPFREASRSGFDHFGEVLRFFEARLYPDDAHRDEPAVRYFTMGEQTWRSADTWPPPGMTRTPWFLQRAGGLSPRAPDGTLEEVDIYQVDFEATSGPGSRWTSLANVADVPIGYPQRRQQDERCLVYQSSPLPQAMELTGHPVLHLFVRCSQPDGLFFAYLEDVGPDGRVEYLTEGLLRALHRRISVPTLILPEGVPYHSYLSTDAAALVPGEIAEIVFDLFPVSYLFRAGHTIRLALAGADRDNFTPVTHRPPRWEVLRSRHHPSHVVLPLRPR